MNKTTQRQLAFLFLLYATSGEYIPTYEFVGEKKMCNEWWLLSYKCPTRLSELIDAMDGMIERKMVTGKSGANYYAYRINPECRTINVLIERAPKEYHDIIYRFANAKRINA